MSERGVFAVDRGIWDHPVLASNEPLSRREAWLWLLSNAVWKSKKANVGKHIVQLERGQLAYSLRFLAEAWGWKKDAVARFLGTLTNHDTIETQTATGITIITICNYNKYQKVSLPKRDRDATATTTETRQQRDKEESKENKENNKAPPAPPIDLHPADAEKQLFDRGKTLFGSSSGGLIKNLVKAKGGSIALARAALETASTKSDPREYLGAIVRGRDQDDNRGRSW